MALIDEVIFLEKKIFHASKLGSVKRHHREHPPNNLEYFTSQGTRSSIKIKIKQQKLSIFMFILPYFLVIKLHFDIFLKQ